MNTLNVQPRTIFCHDNLDVLQGINSGCIDLIYLDPPFNKKKVFVAPAGSAAQGAEFSDIFREEDIKDDWVKSIAYENPPLHSYLAGVKTFSNRYNYCYLVYMAIRLIECRRLLKGSGCLFLHCDPTMSHYLKIVMDCIFGEGNFRNEIVWCYSNIGKAPIRFYPRKHDIILMYAKGEENYFAQQDVAHHKIGQPYAAPDWWIDISSFNGFMKPKNDKHYGYPTQKPVALLERVIATGSRAGWTPSAAARPPVWRRKSSGGSG